MKVIDKKTTMLLLSGVGSISGVALSSAPKTVNANDNKLKTSNTVDELKTDTKKSNNKSATVEGHTEHYKIIRVKSGDTTWDIAEDYNDKHDKETSVAQIVEDNDLENGGSLIHVGQKLKVRADDGKPKEAAADQAATANVSAAPQLEQNSNSISYTGSQVNQNQGTNQNYGGYHSYQSQIRTSYSSSATGNEKAAKEWIAMRESGGSYTARNPSSGTYGRYQLTPDKLGGDTSPANQERVADQYVKTRYGSWQGAKLFWLQNHWY